MSLLQTLFTAPKSDWLLFLGFFIGISIFIGIAEKIRSSLGWSPEVTRKLVHILVGILVFFTPFFFTSGKPLLWMAVLFMIVDFIGVRTGALKGMHGTSRTSYGTVFYPLTFFILVAFCWQGHKVVLMLAMLILALPDALAAIVGENLKHPHEYKLGEDKKSIEGSLTMAVSTFLIVFLIAPSIGRIDGLVISYPFAAWMGVLTALLATALEAVSSKGSDNITAPLGSAFVIWFMLNQPHMSQIQLTIGFALALGMAIFAILMRFLNASGSVSTFVLAAIIFGAGGWAWTLPILTFFIISSLLSKMGKAHKKRFDAVFEKSDTRDVGQVIANGGLPGLLVIIHTFYPDPVWYTMYLAAVAAVNADTWATEIGVFSRSKPRMVTNFKVVDHGISGGVTRRGLLAAFAGSLLIVLSGWMVVPENVSFSMMSLTFWVITFAGFLAALIDSLLGATVQAQYRCPECKKVTEKQIHCGEYKTERVSGLSWINNDLVNFLCALSAAVLIGLFFM